MREPDEALVHTREWCFDVMKDIDDDHRTGGDASVLPQATQTQHEKAFGVACQKTIRERPTAAPSVCMESCEATIA
jgi:hypothetical protein